ncbi:MAG: redoxin domain-containing protein [Deltaproteobacteria bacterium]|nr:redoxin domain-containing protein [Deltaproteobacteria bacterium]
MAEPPILKAGEAAPDFSLPDADGIRRQLSELARERPCVVIFYRGHW